MGFQRMTELDDDYGTCERTYTELRIYSESLSPDEITQKIGVTPTSTQVKGEIKKRFLKINSNLAVPKERTVPINGWFFSSEGTVASKDVRRHLDFLLSRIKKVESRFLELQNEELTIGINCVWWSANNSGGPAIWPEQMACLGELGLELSFDFCFYGDDPIL